MIRPTQIQRSTALQVDGTAEELKRRLRQQQILAEFGLFAFRCDDIGALLQAASASCAEAMQTPFCKVLEYMPGENRFLVKAGVGWRPGLVGCATVGGDLESPAGYAFHTGEPVISNHLEGETRFRTPLMLAEHGIKRAMNVLIAGEHQPYGVLETDSGDSGKFDEPDIYFLQSMANLLGVAIEEKRVHAKLAENERQFRLLAGSIPQLVWMADAAGSLFWFNQRWYDFTGSDSDAMKEGGWMELLHPEHRDRVTARLQKSWDTGEPWEDTFPLRGANGVYRWFLSRAMPFKDGDGRVVRWFGTNTDITEQREAEERQKMLSQEVSHRVKNSLAMVASLLGLQSRVVANEEVRRAIADAQTRVQTIAQVHDQLWRRYDANNIDLAGFLQGLCVKLQETSLEHRIQFEGEPVSIRTDRVIPIGILVNELVTNAFKYAYPEGGGGQVRVSLATEEDGSIVMSVSDRGVGLPHGFDLSRSTSSLGTRLISAMVRQLSGTIQTSRLQPGACFEVRIPSDEAVEGGWHPAA